MSSVNICYCSLTAPPPQEKTCKTFSLLTNKEKFFYTFYAKSNYTIHIKQMYEYNETRNNEYSMECFIEIRYIYIYMSVSTFIKKKEKTPVAQKRTSVHYYLESELHYNRNNVIEY